MEKPPTQNRSHRISREEIFQLMDPISFVMSPVLLNVTDSEVHREKEENNISTTNLDFVLDEPPSRRRRYAVPWSENLDGEILSFFEWKEEFSAIEVTRDVAPCTPHSRPPSQEAKNKRGRSCHDNGYEKRRKQS